MSVAIHLRRSQSLEFFL